MPECLQAFASQQPEYFFRTNSGRSLEVTSPEQHSTQSQQITVVMSRPVGIATQNEQPTIVVVPNLRQPVVRPGKIKYHLQHPLQRGPVGVRHFVTRTAS